VAVGFISLVAGVILVRLGLLLCYQLLGTTRPLRGESTGRAARSPLSTSARAVAVKHGGSGGMHGLQGGQHALRLTNDTPFGQRAFQVVQRAIQAGGRLGHRPCYVSVPARDADSDEDGSWASEHGPEVTATAASSYAMHVGRSPPGKRATPRSHGDQPRKVQQHGGKIQHLAAVAEQQQQAGQVHDMGNKSEAPTSSSRGLSGEAPPPLESSRVKSGGDVGKSEAPTSSSRGLSGGAQKVAAPRGGDPPPLKSSRVKSGGQQQLVASEDAAQRSTDGDTEQGDGAVYFRSVPVKFLWAGQHTTVTFTGRVPTVQALAVELARLGSSRLGCELKASEMKIESKQRDRMTGVTLREAVLPSTDLAGIRLAEALLISSW